jgi:putative intracellular protease/amidase/YHS domain-containing protein
MKRRELLQRSVTLGLAAGISPLRMVSADFNMYAPPSPSKTPSMPLNALTPPAAGAIPVAFVISKNAVLIDFVGPWEVFDNVMVAGRGGLFDLYTVSEKADPIRASGGMKIVPDHTFQTAPAPKVVVIPAQENPSEATLEWIRQSTKNADVIMSVCTGAYVLAQTGLLAGKSATTHHASYIAFANAFPDIRVKRGVRFVEDGKLASSGGLSCGIDLAFRVVERYYGREATKQAAYDMEYQGLGWLNPDSNAVYAQVRISANGHPLCAVCGMDVDAAHGPKSEYRGRNYHFCSQDHKDQFDAAPAKFVSVTNK